MRFIQIYLVAYFLLIVGAALALWRAGVLTRISPSWLLLSVVIVVGLGLLLAVISVRPSTITRE